MRVDKAKFGALLSFDSEYEAEAARKNKSTQGACA